MNEIFYSFDQMIYKGAGSWMRELHVAGGPEQLLRGLKEECRGVQLLHDVDFSKGGASKRDCISVVIEDEGRRFLNALQAEMDDAFNECERSFFVHEALNVVEQQLERTALLISDHRSEVEFTWYGGYSSLYSFPDHYCVVANKSATEMAYVLVLVKSQLIRLYLEVQERYKGYVRRNVLTLEDIHRVFFGEAVPETSCVDKVDKVVKVDKADCDSEVDGDGGVDRDCRGDRDGGVGCDGEVGCDREVERDGEKDRVGKVVVGGKVGETGGEMVTDGPVLDGPMVDEPVAAYGEKRFEPVEGYEEKGFRPVMGDTRPVVEGVLAYEIIVGNQRKFAQMEMDLFDHELIDADSRFKKKPHGNVLKMAAVYWVAYHKGYFQKHYSKEKQRTAVTANDVRAFLNHRYQADIDRQFRNFKVEKVLNAFLDRELWISIIGKY